MDRACGQADLVAVGRVAGGSRRHELALRKLAFKRFRHGNRGVARAGDAHGLVHVAASRKRVADSASQARGRAAERLDFGGMVVRLVLEEVEPILVLAVDVDRALHRAGVDLLGLVETGQDALGFQPLRADGAHVHKADGLLVAAELVAQLKVALVGLAHLLVVDHDVGELGAERGMAAVIRPVGVDHLDFGDGRTALLAREILLAKRDVRKVHRQTALLDEPGKTCLVQIEETLDDLDGLGRRVGDLERFARNEARLARLDRVDDVVLHRSERIVSALALDDVDLREGDVGTLTLADELDALRRGVGALVELAGQRFDGEHVHIGGSCGDSGDVRPLRGELLGGLVRELDARNGKLARGIVDLRLGEHRGDATLEKLLVDALDVVAVDQAQASRLRKPLGDGGVQLGEQLLRFDIEAGLLLHVYTRNHDDPFQGGRRLLVGRLCSRSGIGRLRSFGGVDLLAAEQAALGLDPPLGNLRSGLFLLLFRLALGCALRLLGAAAFLGILGFHFHLVLAAALADLREVEVERKDDEHVGQTERDVADPRRLPRAGEPRQRNHDHRGDQDDPPKAAQALVFRCGRIVVLAVELVLLGALGLAASLLLRFSLLRGLRRGLDMHRGGSFRLRLRRGRALARRTLRALVLVAVVHVVTL